MESRLIFESANTYIRNVIWKQLKIDAESEWIYLGDDDQLAKIEKVVLDYFNSDELFVALNRTGSFKVDKELISNKIKPLIGNEDFTIWNVSFQEVIEFNKLGVYRVGINARN